MTAYELSSTYECYGPVIFLEERATPSRLGTRFLSLREHHKVMLQTDQITGLVAIFVCLDRKLLF